jgi:ubiquinone/menaquinone biosynthesis C-methylase UbiE
VAGDPTKEITKLVWSQGNYEEVAKRTIAAATSLVDAAAVSDGDKVLDVATGSGNVAILCAQRGAVVSASDITPAMIELARARAERDGLEIDVREADAEELPYEDGTFDHVFSVFGAMFAPRPAVAAAEMFRVAKPGGLVGMANWAPGGLIGRQSQIFMSAAPGGPPDIDPLSWGTDDAVVERFGPDADKVETAHLSIREEYESLDAVIGYYETNLGPMILLKQAIEAPRYEEMMQELRDLYASFNQATDGSVVVDAEYLQVIARKRA